MAEALPQTMRAAVLRAYEGPEALEWREVAVPAPGPGEVLVRIFAAPINPSDLVFLRNQYGVRKSLPVVPGFEGSGTVIAAGGGWYGRWLVGRRVACRAPENGHGTWAAFMICPAGNCIPLRRGVSLEQGASLIVNPLTAWSLLERVRREGHRAVVQSAAASALGRMIARLFPRYGVDCIHVVRREEQVQALQAQGLANILDSSQPEFDARLQELAGRLDATVLLDAVGGELTGRLLAALPRGAQAIVYGALSGEACEVSPGELIFRGKRVSGFWLSQWIKHMSMPARICMAWQVQGLLRRELATTVQARFSLERVREAIDHYREHRSQGKVLLMPEAPRS